MRKIICDRCGVRKSPGVQRPRFTILKVSRGGVVVTKHLCETCDNEFEAFMACGETNAPSLPRCFYPEFRRFCFNIILYERCALNLAYPTFDERPCRSLDEEGIIKERSDSHGGR